MTLDPGNSDVLAQLDALRLRLELVLKGLNDTIGSDRDHLLARLDALRGAGQEQLDSLRVRLELVLKGLNDTMGSDRSHLLARLDELRGYGQELLPLLRTGIGGPGSAVNEANPALLERLWGATESARQLQQSHFDFRAPEGESPFARGGKWTHIGGGEGQPGWGKAYRIRGLASRGDELLVSASDGLTIGGTVWRWAQGGWQEILGPSRLGVLRHRDVMALLCVGSVTYAAGGGPPGGVLRIEGDQVDDLPLSEKLAGGDHVSYCLAMHRGELYVGCQLPATLYRLKGDRLELVAGNGEEGSWSPERGYGGVYELKSDGHRLYAAMSRPSYGPVSSDIWAYDGEAWEMIAGNGTRGSWLHPHICYVYDLCLHDGHLVAAVTRPRTMPRDVSSVYAFDGEEWRPVGRKALPTQLADSHIVNHMVSWRGRLYAGSGDTGRSIASVWELDGDRWKQVAGGARFPAWDMSYQAFQAREGRTGGQWIYRMHVHQDRLYAGLAGSNGGAQLWRFDPAD